MYSALLEACNNAQLNAKLGILQESTLDEVSSLKMQKILNENISFIKDQITRTDIVENIQSQLADVWTNAILEDMDYTGMFSSEDADEGMSPAAMAGAGALGAAALGAGARYGVPAVQAGYKVADNVIKNPNVHGFGNNVQKAAMGGLRAAATNVGAGVNQDYNAAKAGINTGINAAQAVPGQVRDMAKGVRFGYKGIGDDVASRSNMSGAMQAGYPIGAAVRSGAQKVSRVFRRS